MRLIDIKNHKHETCRCPKPETAIRNRRIRSIFYSMKRRCYDEKNKDYQRYGQRGIKICKEWLNDPVLFEKWSHQNKYQDNLTIDRIDVDGNYCPENCRWVTQQDNARYKSTTNVIEVDGMIRTGREWSKTLNLGKNTINRFRKINGDNKTRLLIHRILETPISEIEHRRTDSLAKLYSIQ